MSWSRVIKSGTLSSNAILRWAVMSLSLSKQSSLLTLAFTSFRFSAAGALRFERCKSLCLCPLCPRLYKTRTANHTFFFVSTSPMRERPTQIFFFYLIRAFLFELLFFPPSSFLKGVRALKQPNLAVMKGQFKRPRFVSSSSASCTLL